MWMSWTILQPPALAAKWKDNQSAASREIIQCHSIMQDIRLTTHTSDSNMQPTRTNDKLVPFSFVQTMNETANSIPLNIKFSTSPHKHVSFHLESKIIH
jgi:hypothetical protein